MIEQQTKPGWRYVVEIPMGFSSAVFTSNELFGSQGAAIDAMNERYPVNEYPDAEHGVMQDDEP